MTRTIVDLTCRANSVSQVVEMFYGIVVVNADARAAGSFPEADDMSDRPDWLVRGRMTTVTDSLFDSSQWHRVRLDLRSQRVLRSEEDELHVVIDNATANDLSWSAFVRVLMKMP